MSLTGALPSTTMALKMGGNALTNCLYCSKGFSPDVFGVDGLVLTIFSGSLLLVVAWLTDSCRYKPLLHRISNKGAEKPRLRIKLYYII